jgi:CDP-diacylglycerol--glycerol-3-phosphate 3-phosphatidyltransferase
MTDEIPTLTSRLRAIFQPVLDGVARALVRVGVTADMITLLGLLLAGAAGFFAARGAMGWAAGLLVLGFPFDAVDGAVARMRGGGGRFGALLDSTADRYGEALVLSGLAYYFSRVGRIDAVMLAFAALFGSVMVSYLRARSEGLGVDNKVGLLTRVERALVLVIALLSGYVVVGLWVLAVFTHVTVAQRLWNAYRQLAGEVGDD